MEIVTRCKEDIIYTWNSSLTIRHCCKLLTCPCLGLFYCYQSIDNSLCSSQRRRNRLPRKYLERHEILSDINQSRRVRGVQSKSRRRCISVDGGSIWGSKIKVKEQEQSLIFKRLPAELRMKVYEYTLCDGEELWMRANEDEQWDIWDVRPEPGVGETGLLRTCKRIYREAISTLYSSNTFRFDSCATLFAWKPCIPSQSLTRIKQIILTTTIGGVYKSSPLPQQYHELVQLFRGMMPHTMSFCLRYRIIEKSYLKNISATPPVDDFWLLDIFERGEEIAGCAVFYEIVEDHTGPPTTGGCDRLGR